MIFHMLYIFHMYIECSNMFTYIDAYVGNMLSYDFFIC